MITHPVRRRRRIMTSRKHNAPAGEPSSPACSMHEADDAYMGYAGKEELTAILTELLEAERAGVRVTHESALTARGGPLGELMRAIEKDEARWCAMLAGHLRMLGQPPSSKLGEVDSLSWSPSGFQRRLFRCPRRVRPVHLSFVA